LPPFAPVSTIGSAATEAFRKSLREVTLKSSIFNRLNFHYDHSFDAPTCPTAVLFRFSVKVPHGVGGHLIDVQRFEGEAALLRQGFRM
jgi:hypothetical protein